jgi:hypothetical protein
MVHGGSTLIFGRRGRLERVALPGGTSGGMWKG